MRTVLNKRSAYEIAAVQHLAGHHCALVPVTVEPELAMANAELWAGALSLLLIHAESDCPHSARNAALLLDCLAEQPEVDDATRQLCERASSRLENRHFRI